MKLNKLQIDRLIVLFLRIVVIICLMPLSYSKEIQEVEARTNSTCVTDIYVPSSGQYYRFTFDNIEHPDNFKPVALLKNIPKPRCNHWSLSLYNSEDNAIKAFQAGTKLQKKKKGNLIKSYGDYLAVGQLTNSDGLKGPDREDGHFEYFSNDGIDLKSKFTVLRKLA